MKYLSNHARIVILEENVRQLSLILGVNIAGRGRVLGCIGQVVENTAVPPEKIPETLTTGALWESPADEEIAKKAEVIALKEDLRCSLNRLRNPNEISQQ